MGSAAQTSKKETARRRIIAGVYIPVSGAQRPAESVVNAMPAIALGHASIYSLFIFVARP